MGKKERKSCRRDLGKKILYLGWVEIHLDWSGGREKKLYMSQSGGIRLVVVATAKERKSWDIPSRAICSWSKLAKLLAGCLNLRAEMTVLMYGET